MLSWRALPLSLATLLLGGALASLATWNLKPTPPRPVSRMLITLPPGQRLAGLDQPAVAFSPDGSRLAYVAIQGGTQQIYLRALDSLESQAIPGTEGGVNPFFSPDSQWLGFFPAQKLKKVPVSGGSVQTIDDAVQLHGASWSAKDTIVFKRQGIPTLQQVPASGGTPQPLTHAEKGEATQRWPEFLADGEAVLSVATTSGFDWANTQLIVQPNGTGERRTLIRGGTQPRYAASGHLLYAQGGTLMAVPFDARRLTAAGAPASVVEGVLQSSASGAAQYSISATGSLVYVRGELQSAQGRMVWVSRNGTEQPVPAPVRTYLFPRVSPDGSKVAVAVSEHDPGPGGKWQISTEGGTEPAWNRNGRELFFRGGDKMMAVDIATQSSFAAGKPRMLFEGRYERSPATSPNYDVSPRRPALSDAQAQRTRSGGADTNQCRAQLV
jgi:Tol biopolymer transport system component